MKIESRDDLILIHSLCDMAVKQHGLQTSPRVHKLAADCQAAIAKLPEIPVPLSPEVAEEVEKVKKESMAAVKQDEQ